MSFSCDIILQSCYTNETSSREKTRNVDIHRNQRFVHETQQEDVMKTHRALVIGIALIAAIVARAQDLAVLPKTEVSHSRENSRKVLDFQKVEVNYLACLNSPIPGVVESALGHITLMRIAYPNQDLRKIRERLHDLASRGATRCIRHKAFIAMQVFANPLAFEGAITSTQCNGDSLLEDLAAQQ